MFPAGALLVVDESALLSSDGVIERLAKLLGKPPPPPPPPPPPRASSTTASRACARRRRGLGHQGTPGHFHSLMVQKHKAQRAPALPRRGNAAREQAVWRIEGALKALTSLRQQGDRSVRGARLLGITWEESSHQQVDEPPQAVRDAVKIAPNTRRCVASCFSSAKTQDARRARDNVRSSRPAWTARRRSSRNSSRRCGGRRSPRVRNRGRTAWVRGFVATRGRDGRRRRRRSKLLLRRRGGGRVRPRRRSARGGAGRRGPGTGESGLARGARGGDSDLPSDSGGGGSLGSLGGGSIADGGACSGDEAGGGAPQQAQNVGPQISGVVGKTARTKRRR